MPQERDTQRSRVYAAEHAMKSLSQSFEGVPEIQAFVNKLVVEAWWRRRWSIQHIEVADGRGRRRAGGSRGYITMPKHARYTEAILHEVAHAVQPLGTAWHGPEFCRILLELVEHVMGPGAHDSLRERMASNRVKVGPPLKLGVPKPLPPPVKRWIITAYLPNGNIDTVTKEARSLRQALLLWGHELDATSPQYVKVEARVVRQVKAAKG